MWAAAIERDGGLCRLAVFLPDLECSGSLDVYDPSSVDEPPSGVGTAVTVCDGHLAWLRANRGEAASLGLIGG